MKHSYLPLLIMGAAAVVLTGCFGPKDKPGTDDAVESHETMTAVSSGAYVSVQYVGRIAGGDSTPKVDDIAADCGTYEVFDTSHQALAEACGVYSPQRNYSNPLEIEVGGGKFIPGFEQSLFGHKVGDIYTITIPKEEAYGEWSEEYIVEIPLDQLTPKGGVATGETLEYAAGDEILTPFGPIKIVEIVDQSAKIDANHPLAGKDLIFDIEITAISDTPTQQIMPIMPEAMPETDMDDDVATQSEESPIEQNMQVMDDSAETEDVQ